jgi:hypothetical protein
MIASLTNVPMAAGFLDGPALWFANRGTGFVLLVLLTFSTMLGVLSTARFSPRLWPRMLTQGLHRNVSLLAVTFLGDRDIPARLVTTDGRIVRTPRWPEPEESS